jgi:hypothetical protein
MSMRKEIYMAVLERLKAMTEIRYVDLWNQNVAFIEQEAAWERPAVFVEFDPIVWGRVKEAAMVTQGTLQLHVVTDWQGSAASDSETRSESLQAFDLLDRIRTEMEGLEGATFSRMTLQQSMTNHNHEELLENIEIYSYKGAVAL